MRQPPRMFDKNSSSSSCVSKFMNKKRFHFFKIIRPAAIQQKRLGLPIHARKFIRKFWKEHSEVVILTVPNGRKWHVELKEIEGDIWLENGWQEFVDYYSIGVGHFLVFRYDGNSCFHVLIFDMSASEMEYPCHIKDFEKPNWGNECQTLSKQCESLEILDVSPPSSIQAESVKGVSNESDKHQTSMAIGHLKPIGKCKSPSKEKNGFDEILNVSPFCKKQAHLVKEVINESEGHQTSKMSRHIPRSRLRYSLRSFERKIIRPTFDSHSRCTTKVKSSSKRDKNSTKNEEAFSPCQVTQSNESDGCDSAMQEESSDHVPICRNIYSTMSLGRWPVTTLMTQVSRDFKSDNPFYLVIMRSTYVNEPFMLNVPSDFARKYFKQDLFLTLRVSDGRSWQVKCGFYVDSGAKMTKGWRTFVKENCLKEGDVCAFELVNNKHNVEMKVVIHRDRSV